MKISLRRLSLTAMLLSASTMAYGQSATGQIGDLDDPADDSTTNAAFEDRSQVGDLDMPVIDVAPVSQTEYPPVSYSDLYVDNVGSGVASSCSTGDCGGTATKSCGTASCKKQRKIGSLFERGSDKWLSAELLLWFPQARRSPPLATTAPNGDANLIGAPGVETVFGGPDGLAAGELSPGFRIDAGRYLSDNFGVGGRFWFLGENGESLSLAGDANSTRNLARPFFDTNFGGSNVGQNNGSIVFGEQSDGATFTGSIAAESNLDILAAEAYARLMFASGDEYRTDLIGGYSFFDINDSLTMTSTSVRTNGGGLVGQTLIFNDAFDAENTFHGGQIGFDTTLRRGKWLFSSLTKIHLGNMSSTLNVSGTSTAGPAGALVTTDGGALALDTIARSPLERDTFAFAPEANVKVGYKFRQRILFTVGYSFIYWNNVALAGENVLPITDGNLLGTVGPFQQPQRELERSSLFVQGIDLGLIIDF